MSATLHVLGYLACAFIAARMALRHWWRQFGSYDGGVGVCIFMAALGPCGTLAMLMIRVMDWFDDREADGHEKLLDLIRGKAPR